MEFHETAVAGAYLVTPQPVEDERGLFARTYCEREFGGAGLNTRWVQCNTSYNRARGTLRGMHYQTAPHEEVKLVRCTRGALYDAIVDLRPDSPTYKAYAAAELTADNRAMLYIPGGCAHGFLTLADNTEVFYQMGAFYAPGAGCGVRWDDPAFGIPWPEPVQVISERDAQYPDFTG